MSMKLLTLIQFLSAFFMYLLMTVLLPALVFHKKLKQEPFCIRFLFYLVTGNFYLMNLVFLLQLLHSSCRFTLIVGTVAPVLIAAVKINRVPVRVVANRLLDSFFRLSRGTLGVKLMWHRVWRAVKRALVSAAKRLAHSLRHHWPDWVFFVLLTGVLFWFYGTSMLTQYGYGVSDLPVHNYWINAMGENEIFVAGVYPFGFHCILYYLHTVFGIETFVLMRVFGVVQTLFLHYVLLAFLKYCCRTRYAAYGAIGIFAAAAFFAFDTRTRYLSALPQEFGMLFILPGIVFLYAFLKARAAEEGKDKWVHSTWYLCGFAMSFSMTLAVHFYGTMVAGFFCIGVAAGFCFRIFRRKYFGRILLAGILSIVIAVLPMGIAFASGTQLQGSLGWGLNVIRNAGQEETPEADTEEVQGKHTGSELTDDKGDMPQGQPEAGSENSGEHGKPAKSTSSKTTGMGVKGIFQAGKSFVSRFVEAARENFQTYIIVGLDPRLTAAVLLLPILLAAAGILFLLSGKNRDYGGILLSTAVTALFLLLLLSAGELGLPALMDRNRCSVYFAYLLPVIFGLSVDAVLFGLTGFLGKNWVCNGLSAVVTVSLSAALIEAGQVRTPEVLITLETNSAITCLTNILHENEDQTFTICSANDELRMVEDYGFHYETIRFLRGLEGENVKRPLTLPTPKVYFFIEKRPLDYTLPYWGSGQTVSKEGAKPPLPGGSGLAVYEGENRWNVMSRMYYWAEAFQKLYENEMRVYYESEDFICYVVEQNMYCLFDFSIDYGYNTAVTEKEAADDIP